MSVRYQRQFPRDLEVDEAGEYLRPKEVVDSDEDRFVAQIRDATVADTRRLKKHAGKDDPTFHEPHWGHGTGLLRGTLEIDRVDALPEQFRVGLFAKKQTLPVVARPNFIHDKGAGLAAGRMAVKAKYPELVPNVYAAKGEAHELDLLFAEGSPEVNGVGHAFFFRDARELAMFTTLKPPSAKTLATLASPRNWGHIARVFKRLKTVLAFVKTPAVATTGWAGKAYYSAGPYVLADGAMKMCLRPRQSHAIEAVSPSDPGAAAKHRTAMEAWLAEGKDAVFDLCVQLATPGCIPAPGPDDPPRSVMIAEYCDLQWDETQSPYVAVGTLTFRAHPDSDLSKEHPWSPLQFNAWNTLPEMRPLGQLFRARKHVHKAHAEARIEHVYDAAPGAMVDKAPFERVDAPPVVVEPPAPA
jgi:hypothetical protein